MSISNSNSPKIQFKQLLNQNFENKTCYNKEQNQRNTFKKKHEDIFEKYIQKYEIQEKTTYKFENTSQLYFYNTKQKQGIKRITIYKQQPETKHKHNLSFALSPLKNDTVSIKQQSISQMDNNINQQTIKFHQQKQNYQQKLANFLVDCPINPLGIKQSFNVYNGTDKKSPVKLSPLRYQITEDMHSFQNDSYIYKNKNEQPKNITNREFIKRNIERVKPVIRNHYNHYAIKQRLNVQAITPYINKSLGIIDQLEEQLVSTINQPFIKVDGGYGDYCLQQHHSKKRIPLKLKEKCLQKLYTQQNQDDLQYLLNKSYQQTVMTEESNNIKNELFLHNKTFLIENNNNNNQIDSQQILIQK